MDNLYEKMMRKCITLAKKGAGKVSPNPMVGCVVLDKNGEVISTGYHHKYGENHAERDALSKLKNGEEKGGTLIVNLEPCSHYGKTPPCADLIIERGIKKVVIGCIDNNPKVKGGGVNKLIKAGIDVKTGVLEDDCRRLNEVFFTDVEQNRTFVALKTATTLDGKISTSSGDSKWITSDKARGYAKRLRKHYDAILTSSSTVIADNPTMKHKTKIISDTNFRTGFEYNIYKSGRVILVIGDKTEFNADSIPDNVEILRCKTDSGHINIKDMLSKIYKLGIKSVFVEAGGTLCGSFIREGCADIIYQFIAPKVLNDNSGRSCFDGDKTSLVSECKQFMIRETKRVGDDILVVSESK